MNQYKPDPSKIQENPFAFKTDPVEARETLQKSLLRMAQFFMDEIDEPGQIEAAWNRYQEANGADAIFRVSSAVSHVLGVREALRAVDDCKLTHDTGWFGSIVILLHVGLIELVEGITHVNLADWMMSQTKNEEPKLPRSLKPADVREYLRELKGQYEEKFGAARLLARALNDGLPAHEKARLLLAYTFSRPYRLGEKTDLSNRKHIHCRERKDRWDEARRDDKKSMSYPWSEVCLQSSCPSPEPHEVHSLLPKLAKRYLYVMRNQLVHAASPVMMAVTNRRGDYQVGSLSDAFFIDDKQIVSYQVSLSVSEVTGILRRCIWNRLSQ